tara:strand:+ start:766 stop:1872 length:1107 start_codon:yes stop_codon:yes gene_type:complete
MKISIGSKIIDGPFGGGMEFLKNLINFLEENGHTVINHLNDIDIDVILLTNPLISSETSTFDSYDIEYYLKFANSQALVFQRFNECDERKGTNNINFKLNKFNQVVDVNIFVSDWLKNVFNQFDISKKKSYVVRGGPNKDIFNNKNKIYWNKKSKLKLVTHHWSDNLMKGYLEYKKLDNFLDSEKYKDLFEFTFIGNKPKNIKFNNIKVLEPLKGIDLANELKLHDIYITASENEPSGNHHMEGALCGLPILYKNSGATSEYCKDYGVSYEIDNFFESLDLIKENYDNFVYKLNEYPFDFLDAAYNFNQIFYENYDKKLEIIEERNLKSKINILFRYMSNKILRNLYIKYFSLKKLLGSTKYNIRNVT